MNPDAFLIGFMVILANFVLAFVIFRAFKRQKDAFFTTLRNYFESPDADTPSEFALVVAQISDRFSTDVMTKAKTTFMGVQSGEAKREKQVAGALAQDSIGLSSPMIGAALESFPALRKLISKNPAIAPLALSALSKLGSPGAGGNGEKSRAAPTSKGMGDFSL